MYGDIYIYMPYMDAMGIETTRNFTIYLCLAYLPRIWGLWHFTNLQFAQSLTQMIHMYGTFAYMYPLNYPNVGKLTMHWVSSLAKPCMCHASWQRVGGFGGFRKTFGSSRFQNKHSGWDFLRNMRLFCLFHCALKFRLDLDTLTFCKPFNWCCCATSCQGVKVHPAMIYSNPCDSGPRKPLFWLLGGFCTKPANAEFAWRSMMHWCTHACLNTVLRPFVSFPADSTDGLHKFSIKFVDSESAPLTTKK